MSVAGLTPFERFLPKLSPQKNGYWLWMGATVAGYGVIQIKGEAVRAHRFSYAHFVSPITNGLFVLHRCDVRGCVNPCHLFLGTQSDNMRDMRDKGRASMVRSFGASHGQTRLTDDEVIAIRSLHASGNHGFASIGRFFGVAKSTAARIVHRKVWKHI